MELILDGDGCLTMNRLKHVKILLTDRLRTRFFYINKITIENVNLHKRRKEHSSHICQADDKILLFTKSLTMNLNHRTKLKAIGANDSGKNMSKNAAKKE